MTRASRPAAALLLVLAALGAAAVLVVPAGGPLALDRAVADALAGVDGAPLAAALTLLGSAGLVVPALAAACLARSRRPAALLPVAVLVLAQAVESVLTGPLVRPAPLAPGTASSGHVLVAVLGWGLVARQVPRLAPRAVPVGLLAGALVGGARVELGLHWLSDVVLGALAGLAVLLAAARLPVPPATPLPSRAAVAAWCRTSPAAWALPALAALVPLVPLLVQPTAERNVDLAVYVGAGGVAAAGGDVYRYATEPGLPFVYPPFAAVLAEPLSRVPLVLVQAGWAVATLLVLVAVARRVLAPAVARLGLPVVLALLLVSSPVRSHLRFGQVGLLLVLLVAVDLLGDDRGRGRGWGVGLAAAVKLTPVVVLPWLVVTRAWGRLAATVGVAAGASLLGLLVLWPSAPDYLLRAAHDTGRLVPLSIPGNQSVHGALLRLDAPAALWPAAVVALLVVGTRGAARLERAGDRLAAVGVLAALAVAVSPISWVHHLVWLLLPLAALVAAGRHRLAAAWAAVLVVPLPSVAALLPDVAATQLLVDAQGLTAVAAVLLLPRLARPQPALAAARST